MPKHQSDIPRDLASSRCWKTSVDCEDSSVVNLFCRIRFVIYNGDPGSRYMSLSGTACASRDIFVIFGNGRQVMATKGPVYPILSFKFYKFHCSVHIYARSMFVPKFLRESTIFGRNFAKLSISSSWSHQ